MPEQLLIYLHSPQAESVSYLILNEQRVITQAAQTTTLAELRELALKRQLCVLFASEFILLSHAHIPATSKDRLRKAVPFAIEEQLLGSIEECHFALGEYFQAKQAVAVIDQSLLQTLLQNLANASLQPVQLIPDVLAIPADVDHWHCLIDADRALVAIGEQRGFAIETAQLETVLTLKISEATHPPAHITITLLNESQYHLSHDIHAIQAIPVEFKQYSGQLITYLAEHVQQQKIINLLQGNFQATQQIAQIKKIWQLPAMLALALFALFLLSQSSEFIYLHAEQNKTQKKIDTIYYHLFPNASSVTSPKLRIERELQRLQGGVDSPFLRLLANSGEVAKQHPAISLRALNFRDNRLDFQVLAPDFHALQQFTQALQKQSLHVSQRNAKTSGKIVTADIEIK